METDQNTDSPFLSPEASNRLRTLMRNACDAYGYGVRELLEELGLVNELPLSTVSKAFQETTTSRIHKTHVASYVKWVAQHAKIDPTAIVQWIHSGQTTAPVLHTLSAQKVYTHTAAGLAEWNARLTALQAVTKKCWLLTESPSPSMIPEEVNQALCRLHTTTSQSFRVESNFAKKRLSQIGTRQEANVFRPWQILSRRGVENVFERLKDPDHRDHLVETLLYRQDCELVFLGYIDDRPGRSGHALHQAFKQFDMRAIFDEGISVRRERDGLRRYLYDAAQSPEQAAVVAEDQTLLHEAMRVAIFDVALIKRWLIPFTSADSWMRRRMDHDDAWTAA